MYDSCDASVSSSIQDSGVGNKHEGLQGGVDGKEKVQDGQSVKLTGEPAQGRRGKKTPSTPTQQP